MTSLSENSRMHAASISLMMVDCLILLEVLNVNTSKKTHREITVDQAQIWIHLVLYLLTILRAQIFLRYGWYWGSAVGDAECSAPFDWKRQHHPVGVWDGFPIRSVDYVCSVEYMYIICPDGISDETAVGELLEKNNISFVFAKHAFWIMFFLWTSTLLVAARFSKDWVLERNDLVRLFG